MKNILYLHTGAELYGADIVLLTLIKGLDKTKYHPIVILPQNGPLIGKLNEIGVENYIVEYPILRRQYFTPKGVLRYVRTYIGSCKEIIKKLKDIQIDIVHVNTIAVLEGIYISTKIQKPLIWHVHEILEQPRFVYKITSFLMGKFATRIIAVSQAVKNHLVASGFISNDKVEVIYNGVNKTIYNPNNDYKLLKSELGLPDDAFVLGMIGRVNAIKGQDQFVKIVASIVAKYKNVYGIIVGDAFPGQEWRVEKLKKLIIESGCENNFRYLGYREDANILHCLFDVYVLPSVSADSLPTVVLESMASRRVVTGYKNGGICEMVRDRESGYLENIGEYKQLADDIGYLIMDKGLYEKMADNSFKRLNLYFSLESFIANISHLYERI